jgi:HSP20 family protein
MRQLQQEINRLFSTLPELAAHDFPPLNVWSNEEGAVVIAEAPGIDPDKVTISVVGDSLTLTGEREPQNIKPGESYHRQERSQGRFSRTLQLPFRVDADRVEAGYEKGMLQIKLPRAEADKPKRIKIASL